MCFDGVTDAEDPLQEKNIVESGVFERILGEGMQRFTALSLLTLQSDLDVLTNVTPSLNLPEYLRLGLLDRETGKFEAIQHLTVAEYARYDIFRRMHAKHLGHGSPHTSWGH